MLYFSEEQWQRLAALSDKTGAPISELVRRAVDSYLKEQKQ
jgi:predicted DNA-binding protein